MSEPFAVIVHAGAGYHNAANEARYLSACRRACAAASAVLKAGGDALEAAEAAIVVLENDPVTNAGLGSNLTLDGRVECDAAMMDGESGCFGAVGAAPGIINPIRAAHALLRQESQGLLPLGRIPPLLLVGEGAYRFAKARGVAVAESPDAPVLVDADRAAAHARYLERLAAAERGSPVDPEKDHDTVGAVCIDRRGRAAAAVSSGGLILKLPGRVGDSAHYGCGCWASHNADAAVGVSTSGKGEQLIKSFFARSAAAAALSADEPSLAVNRFLVEDFVGGAASDEKDGGLVMLRRRGGVIDVVWAHTTRSLAIAYASSEWAGVRALCSRREAGEAAVVGGAKVVAKRAREGDDNESDELE